MNKKSIVIFDLDGTLTNTLVSIQKTTNIVLEAFGLAPYEVENYRYFVGDGSDMLVERAFVGRGITEQTMIREAQKLYQKEFEKYCMYEVRPYEGIRELLDFCREKGIQLGVNSNKPHERTIEVVQTIFGRETFDYIVGQSDLRDKKPSADGVNFILREAGLSKEDAVYVGDTSTDMMTGHNAEVFTVGVLWGFRDEAELKQYKADAIISKPMELAAYLE